MIRTRLQTFSTTSSTCELYRMVFPADAKAAIRSLIMMDAFTSSPESGSSSRMRSGSWRSAAAMRIFWRMPLEYVSRRLTRSDERSNVSSMQAIDPTRDRTSPVCRRSATAACLRPRHASAPIIPETLAGETFEQDRCLGHIADPRFHIDSSFGQGKSRDGHASGRGSQDARDDLDSGGLAGAIGAEQADDLAPVESERYAMQDFRAVVAKDDLVERGYGFRQERILLSSYCSRDCRANVMAFDG